MASRTKSASLPARNRTAPVRPRVDDVMAWLKRRATRRTLDGMARYGLPSDHALGVSMADLKVLGTEIGPNHALAVELWDTGVYEARLLVSFVADPAKVTSAQMDRWCRDFDNWGICDTICFHLFDRSPHAWKKVRAWSARRDEFVKRAAFALLASLALHDKAAETPLFLDALPLIERAAGDERNFVKKGVSWALRAVGRRNPALNRASVEVARRLAASEEAAPRWVGRDALGELTAHGGTRR